MNDFKENITELKQFYIDDVLCITARFSSRDLSYYVGYACFSDKYKDVVNYFETNPEANITFFNSYEIPPLLAGVTIEDKNIQDCNFCYLGTDTAHLVHWNNNTEATAKEFLTEIVKIAKEKLKEV